MVIDRIIVKQEDPRQLRMAKSAAWLYWIGIFVVMVGTLLPVETAFERTPIFLLILGGSLSTVALILIPWQIFSYKLFYLMAGMACSHIATLVYFSGGVESPYNMLYFLIAVWASYFFSFKGFSLVMSMIVGCMLIPFWYDQDYDLASITTALISIVFIFIAGGLVNLLVAQVKGRNRELRRINERLDQNMREILREKEKSNAVLASVADGVYVADNNNLITMWNESAERITGFGAAEIIGKECYEYIPGEKEVEPEKHTPILETAAHLDKDGGSFSYEVLTCRKDGERVWLAISAAPIMDADGNLFGMVHVFRDISGYKEIDRMKSDFVATVSHELRTPLTSILGFSKTLLRADVKFPDSSRESFLMEIVREGERLARLIEDLLSVSRIESGRLHLDLKPLEIIPSVSQVIKNVSKLTSIHSFEVNIGEDIPPVTADPDKLHQVILNLVINAVKYSPDGGRIGVSAEKDGEKVLFKVEDHGVGISEDHLPHIFERFYRVTPTTQGGVTGTGLGLYVSKNLVKEMGGRIWAESTVGKGSKFFFELPVAYSENMEKTAGGEKMIS